MASGTGANGIDFKRLVAGVYVTMGDVRSLSGPSMTRAAIDNTHSTSPAGWREFIGGLRDGGEVERRSVQRRADRGNLKLDGDVFGEAVRHEQQGFDHPQMLGIGGFALSVFCLGVHLVFDLGYHLGYAAHVMLPGVSPG